jgi:hypothetical protein
MDRGILAILQRTEDRNWNSEVGMRNGEMDKAELLIFIFPHSNSSVVCHLSSKTYKKQKK